MNISIEFNNEVMALLERFSKEKHCTISDFIKKAVLEKLEDLEDCEAAVEAWEEYEMSGYKSFSAEDVFKELGL